MSVGIVIGPVRQASELSLKERGLIEIAHLPSVEGVLGAFKLRNPFFV